MAAAVSGLSPVIITVRMPIARSCANFSRMPCLTTSDSSITPSTWRPSATTSGVAPLRATCSTRPASSAGTVPPSACTWLRIASSAPFRICRPCSRSTPDMRVCALKAR
ncbi:hypothetical protein G6F55_014479 [Rhizopus delemar]|nr:hypothetical protein G6F55_014479 [Rhizopus delemar]